MKKIEDYLHLYIPFQFEWIDDAVPFHKGDRGRMDGDGLRYWDAYKKPILRPLSSMTEEEYLEAGKVFFDYGNKYVYPVQSKNDMIDLIKGGMKICWHLNKYFELTHYLLSKHFDLFGLIESGLAISKTSIKATT